VYRGNCRTSGLLLRFADRVGRLIAMSLPGSTTYDALVVGAGPAGSHLACLLARTGRRVALIDKQRFPREKVCGGGLTRKAVALLDIDIDSVVHRWIQGAYLTFQNRATIVKDVNPAAGCTVLRNEFDQALVERACDAGAQFFAGTALIDVRADGESAVASTSRGEFKARRLFAADGVGSTARTKIFGKHSVSYVPALEALVRIPDNAMERYGDRVVFDFGGMPRGYGWIFPKSDHLNVGVYSPFGATQLREHLDRFIDRYPALRHRRDIEYRGFAIPIRNEAKAFERGNVALVGDAAGLAESLFGEGIYFALKSAALAAQSETGHDAMPMCYTELLRRELLPELRAAAWLAKVLFAFQAFTFRHLVCNERVNDLFTGLLTGETGYRECLRKTALAAPRWLMRSAQVFDIALA
jgi:geranylgeranyl reductase family protein